MTDRGFMSLLATFKDVRAVSDAKIILDGLTVLCGRNSSGKTTISRTIQDVIEAILYLKVQIRDSILDDLYHDIRRPMRDVLASIDVDIDKEHYLDSPNMNSVDFTRDIIARHMEGLENLLRSVFSSQQWKDKKSSVLFHDFSRNIVLPASEIKSYVELEEWIINRVHKAQSDLDIVEMTQLSEDAFTNRARLKSRYLWDGHVEIEEEGEIVVSYTNRNVESSGNIRTVSNVIYIESPLVSALQFYKYGSFRIENNLVPVRGSQTMTRLPSDIISRFVREMLDGEVKPDKAPTGRNIWAYERVDGDDREKYDLEDCATGIKGVAIIANLYNQGCLSDKTLLIIDEPEAHLHPEWIVAYARILVLLVKRIGLRVLLSSHSPDMINALQAFSTGANISKWTHFYQATPSRRVNNKFKYEFIDKKMSVSDIFDSFNNVYDLINKYASTFRSEG